MDLFKPLRSSPPYKPTKAPVAPSEASSIEEPLAEELRDLSPEDVELLDTVIERAGPSAKTFLTVFKAYSEILTDKGLDPHETLYYTKLLKLGTMKGRNWGEKWGRVKAQLTTQKSTKHRLPNGIKPGPPPHIRFDEDTMSEFSTFSDKTAAGPSHIGVLRKEHMKKRAESSISDALPGLNAPYTRHLPSSLRYEATDSPQRNRLASPASKRKEEIARDIVARAKERKGSTLNDADAWKNIQMQQNERDADLFREDKLVERCWQIWLQGYQWVKTTTQQITEAREQLIVQRCLEKWRAKRESHQKLYKHINDLSNRRVLVTFLRHWQNKAVESRQKKWRQDMRNKMKLVRHNHETRLITEVWSKWRGATQEKLVYQGYLERLMARMYVGWKQRVAKNARLAVVADEFYEGGRGLVVNASWRKWKKALQYRIAESTMRRRVDLRILDNTLTRWRRQRAQYAVADELNARNLQARLFKKWIGRLSQVNRLERRADKQLAKSDTMLLYAVMRIWRAKKNGHIMERDRSKQLKTLAWNLWKLGVASHRADELRAEEFSNRANSSLAVTALVQWKRAYEDVQAKERLADAFHASHTAIIALAHWRKRLRRKTKMLKAAKAAQQYFMMRRAWLTWIEKVEERRRERLLQHYLLHAKKRKFEVWLRKARLAKERNQAAEDMQYRISKRILRTALAKWTDRVIAVKSREIDIVQHTNMITMMTAFQKWKTRHNQHIEAQNLLESFMYLKQRDSLRRTFYRWLTTARFSSHRRVVLQEREDELRLRKLEAVWDKWREKTLRSREDEVLLQRQRNILCKAFAKWNGKTKAPPAIRFDSHRVKATFFKKWKGAMSQTHKLKEAVNHNRLVVTAKLFEAWLERYRAQKTLKAVARARHLRLPAAPPKTSGVRTSSFSRRSDFLRPPSTRGDDDDAFSDAGSAISAVSLPRPASVTSSTYISTKSARPPSVMSNSSRYSYSRPREPSPTRRSPVPSSASRIRRDPSPFRRSPAPAPSSASRTREISPVRRLPTISVSRARSDTTTRSRSPSPSGSRKKGPSSVVSDVPVRRGWPGMQRTRPFIS